MARSRKSPREAKGIKTLGKCRKRGTSESEPSLGRGVEGVGGLFCRAAIARSKKKRPLNLGTSMEEIN